MQGSVGRPGLSKASRHGSGGVFWGTEPSRSQVVGGPDANPGEVIGQGEVLVIARRQSPPVPEEALTKRLLLSLTPNSWPDGGVLRLLGGPRPEQMPLP